MSCLTYFSSHDHLVRLFDFTGKSSADLAALNESLQDLLDGIQVIYSPEMSFVNFLLCPWLCQKKLSIERNSMGLLNKNILRKNYFRFISHVSFRPQTYQFVFLLLLDLISNKYYQLLKPEPGS